MSNDFTDKFVNTAQKAGEAIEKGVDAAAKVAGELYESSKANIRLFNLQNELDILYKELGRLIHSLRSTDNEAVDTKLQQIDSKIEEIAAYKKKAEENRQRRTCKLCGRTCSKTFEYCPACGTKLD